jgi:hypothetical protein
MALTLHNRKLCKELFAFSLCPKFVIAGLVPAIHGCYSQGGNHLRKAQVLRSTRASGWITGTSPVMTLMRIS